MNEVRVSSWAELNEVLFDEPINPIIGRYRSNYAFRGLANTDFDLSTTLMRLGTDAATLEPHIIRSFEKYAHLEMHESASIWNWLSLAQHHGLPTRLLDWTYSPYVAAHFATDNHYDADGVIFCVDFVETNTHLPPRLRRSLEQSSARVFTTGMLDQEVRSLEEYDVLRDEPFVVFIEPPSLDSRIVNQYALFSIMSAPGLAMDQWLPADNKAWRKVIIPRELKWEVRDKLDQAGINERMLFPGLDGLCRYLARYYSPTDQTSKLPEISRLVPRSGN